MKEWQIIEVLVALFCLVWKKEARSGSYQSNQRPHEAFVVGFDSHSCAIYSCVGLVETSICLALIRLPTNEQRN